MSGGDQIKGWGQNVAADPEEAERNRLGERLLKVLDSVHAEKVFADPVSAKEFLQKTTYENFARWMTYANDTLREKNRSKSFDGKTVRVQETGPGGLSRAIYVPPDEPEKERLLRKSFEIAQRQDNVRDAGVLLGLAITSTHIFNDGNGRTARLILSLFANGYDGSPESRTRLSSILGSSGRNIVDPNIDSLMGVLSRKVEGRLGVRHGDPKSATENYSEIGADVGELNAQTLPLSFDADAQMRTAIADITDVPGQRHAILFKFLSEENMLREPFVLYRESPSRAQFNMPEKWTMIQIDEVLKALTPEQSVRLIETAKEIRSDFIEQLLEFYDKPNEYKSADGGILRDAIRRHILKEKA